MATPKVASCIVVKSTVQKKLINTLVINSRNHCIFWTITRIWGLWILSLIGYFLFERPCFISYCNGYENKPEAFQLTVVDQILEKYHTPIDLYKPGRRGLDQDNLLRLTAPHFPSQVHLQRKRGKSKSVPKFVHTREKIQNSGLAEKGLTEYVELMSRSDQQLLVACERYLPKDSKIKVHVSSPNNLKQHKREYISHNTYSLKRALSGARQKGELILTILMMLAQVAVILTRQKNTTGSTAKHRGIVWVAAIGICVPQVKLDKCIVNLFVSNMIHLRVVESKSFGALIKTLNPSKNSISRRTLGTRIADEHIQLKQHLIK
ncbi:hypothetical protein WA026_004549 [Henosepilachna vigintioctopunctata]|uniref:Uncharacterized protein n=1 Tax=Henosepilachna vigintioctopunctata TaxID=420089 RepID=A0AAW1V3N0_9CUCU